MSEAPQRQPVSSECHEQCRYSLDMAAPEHRCSNGCLYAAREVEQRNQDIIRLARRDHRVNDELEIDDDNVKVSEGDDFDTQAISSRKNIGRCGFEYRVEPNHPFAKWDAIITDTFFSGVLFRFVDDESVIVGRFCA